jgi:class 3 adenylate cyclase/tetratricopeptide (TPR) repeat protein
VSFIEILGRAKAHLREQGRLSFRALEREFDLDDATLAELVEELVDVQQVAAREGKVLSWVGRAAAVAEQQRDPTPEPVGDAERRQLTVMFCDLVDSTELAGKLGAEELREVIRAFQEATAQVVERFEGYVAQYLGDGLLVYFGWPQAHEDDAERGVRAGREILQSLEAVNGRLSASHGVELEARVGIHTGPVVLGEVGGGGKRETLALGETANVAARIQGQADPGAVLISGETLDLVRGIFVTETLAPRALKGVAVPLALHRVIAPSGVRSRLDVAGDRLSRFVGRQEELGIMADRWEQAAFLSGEAGLGKSRLALVLREQLSARPHTWLECRSSPYTQASALHPVIELVEQGLAFRPDDAPEARRRKVEDGVAIAGLDSSGAVPLVADLLGVPLGDAWPPLQLSPERQRERTFETLVGWLLALGELQPVLLLIEDLHWSDASSLELFGRLIEQIPTSRVLMLLTARPEFEVPWTHPKSWTPLTLGRLRKPQARDLIRSLSEARPLPEAAEDEIIERADGVPLYLEELTRAAVESEEEGAPLTIPATLQDSLMARLDRLSAAKEVAQLASVLGREFSYALLEASAEIDEASLRHGLERLVYADLVFQRGTPPAAHYTFKHALIQERAYESLLQKRRREVHARVARAIEERFPERAEAEPELLGQHWEGAGKIERAIVQYQRAGERATERSAHQEAIAHLDHGIALLDALPEGSERDRLELELRIASGPPLTAVRGFGTPELQQTYTRARELCDGTGEDLRLLRPIRGLAAHHWLHGDLELGLELGQQALRLAEQAGDIFALVHCHTVIGQPLYFLGRLTEALEHNERAVALYDPVEHGSLGHVTGYDEGCVSHGFASWTFWALGYPDRSLERGRRAIEIGREVQHPLGLAHAWASQALTHRWRGEAEASRACAEEAIELASGAGFPLYRGMGLVLRGWADVEAGGGEKAVAEAQRGLVEAAQVGTVSGAPYFLLALAQCQGLVGRYEDAIGALDASLAANQPVFASELKRVKGEILLQTGKPTEAEAETLFRDAVEVARHQEARSFELRAATSLARLWQRQGKQHEARDLLRPVYDWFTEGFDTKDLEDAKALLQELA